MWLTKVLFNSTISAVKIMGKWWKGREGTCGTAQMKNALTCFFCFQVYMNKEMVNIHSGFISIILFYHC